MSSYHSSFKFLDKKSDTDFGWMIAHFEADNGETESYLSQEQVYTSSYNGARRLLYGTKWNAAATVKITVIKQNMSDFTEMECRNAYKWLTGNPMATYLDLYVGDVIRYSFLGTVQDVKPQKLDARTVGLNIYFESISPWAYSAVQTVTCSFGQLLSVDSDGLLVKGSMYETLLNTTNGGVLYNGTNGGGGVFKITNDGTVFLDNMIHMKIDNQTDDMYSFITLNTVLHNTDSDYVSIYNQTLNEETIIENMSKNEQISLTSGQFIVSDVPGKMFGNNFNYIWPRLAPGMNDIIVRGTGSGYIEFTYRYPVKIGDCAVNIGMFDSACNCDGLTDYGMIDWSDIVNTPDTLAGYGVIDSYTASEIDEKLANIEIEVNTDVKIDENDLNNMLEDILG